MCMSLAPGWLFHTVITLMLEIVQVCTMATHRKWMVSKPIYSFTPFSPFFIIMCEIDTSWILLKYLACVSTVYPKKYAHGFCFAVLCCGYTLTDFPISIRLTSLALWQSKDCPSASKATLMNMDKYFMLIHYERLHNHNKAKHNKTVCIFLGIYCTFKLWWQRIPNTCNISQLYFCRRLQGHITGKYELLSTVIHSLIGHRLKAAGDATQLNVG